MIIAIAIFCLLAALFLFTLTLHAEVDAEREHFGKFHPAMTAKGTAQVPFPRVGTRVDGPGGKRNH